MSRDETQVTPTHCPKTGRFLPANNAGKKKRPGRNALKRAATAEDMEEVCQKIVAQAKDGCTKSQALLVGTLISGPLRPSHGRAKFDLDLTDIESSTRSILTSISEGRLNIEQGQAMIASLKSATDIQTAGTLAQRLSTMEANLANLANQQRTYVPSPAAKPEDNSHGTEAIERDTGAEWVEHVG